MKRTLVVLLVGSILPVSFFPGCVTSGPPQTKAEKAEESRQKAATEHIRRKQRKKRQRMGSPNSLTKSFAAEVPVHMNSGVLPAEMVTVGMRLAPAGSVPASGIEPAGWRYAYLELTRTDSAGEHYYQLNLLRPASWFAERGITAAGDELPFSFPELRIAGSAKVEYFGPCPSIEPGAGPVVTTTAVGYSGCLHDIHFANAEVEPVRATPGHAFRDADKRWLELSDLKPGDRMAAAGGSVQIERIVKVPTDHFSFSIIAEDNAPYMAGEQRIITRGHN